VSGSAAADTESADTESADPESKVSSEVGTLADSTHVTAEALENAQRVPTNVVPGSAVNRETGHGSAGKRGLATKDAIKKADPGTAWLKKFNH
jgi:hypothetical protein